MSKRTEDILKERQRQHGDFKDNAHAAQSFKALAAEFPNHSKMTEVQREGLDMIFGKIGRVLSGNPNLEDHWADISGFAELVVRDLRGREKKSLRGLTLNEDGKLEIFLREVDVPAHHPTFRLECEMRSVSGGLHSQYLGGSFTRNGIVSRLKKAFDSYPVEYISVPFNMFSEINSQKGFDVPLRVTDRQISPSRFALVLRGAAVTDDRPKFLVDFVQYSSDGDLEFGHPVGPSFGFEEITSRLVLALKSYPQAKYVTVPKRLFSIYHDALADLNVPLKWHVDKEDLNKDAEGAEPFSAELEIKLHLILNGTDPDRYKVVVEAYSKEGVRPVLGPITVALGLDTFPASQIPKKLKEAYLKYPHVKCIFVPKKTWEFLEGYLKHLGLPVRREVTS